MTQPSSPPSAKVWLITGCSSGFGRELALAARKHGDYVIATARRVETLSELNELGCQTLTLDVTSDDGSVTEVAAKANAFYGRIDILVNNAGYSTFGSIEEASADDIEGVFNTNVFGTMRVTRAVLPYMREKRSGTVANIGSTIGYVSVPPFGVYGATKAAIASLSQTLRLEVAGLGIKVTVIEPAGFHTSGPSALKICANQIADYQSFKQASLAALMSLPMGNVVKGAQAIVEALTQTGRGENRELPSRLPLGGGYYDKIQKTLDHGKKELEDWKDFTNPEAFVSSGQAC
ncbi:hypothetical protein Poli38472_007572 [Pythium oligandrum]|uniref:Ketoreductase domain-containing protein n=1 Tax=Pythium oligandrum TaxID=41045 RepID=A0A8K1CQX4_PYTOL|nr:hypothetical protein Poli38472_007572 [Pythium oligandrum]|eukprot:TMW67900.1 hypothetical protein Poli38472_007572 [Pythium oligandrum]